MASPPPGVSDEDWAAARIRAAGAEIDRRMEHGGFRPAEVLDGFIKGWCDTSGNVAAFVRPATIAKVDTKHPFAACKVPAGCENCKRIAARFNFAAVL